MAERYAKFKERNQFSGGGRGGRGGGRGGRDRGGFGDRGGGRSGGGWSNSWLTEERDGGRQDRARGGYAAESSRNSVTESDGGWAKNMSVGGGIQSHTDIINSEESWD